MFLMITCHHHHLNDDDIIEANLHVSIGFRSTTKKINNLQTRFFSIDDDRCVPPDYHPKYSSYITIDRQQSAAFFFPNQNIDIF